MNKDIIYNYFNKILVTLIRFFLIPIYLENFGHSGYGLISFYYSLFGMAVILDFGIGYTVTNLLSNPKKDQNLCWKIVKTLEIFYIICSILLGIVIISNANTISEIWLNVDDVNLDGTNIIYLMGVLMIFSWPVSFYESILCGKFKFYQKNNYNTLYNILLSASVFIFDWLKILTIEKVFYIFIFSSISHLIVLKLYIYIKFNPKGFANINDIKKIMSFSANACLFTLTSLIIMQLPILILSLSNSTTYIGYYTIATTIPLFLISLLYPISSAAYPRLTNINNNQYTKKYFLNAFRFVLIITNCFVVLIFYNNTYIYNIWLPEKGINNNILETTQIVLAGVYFHANRMILNVMLLSNGFSFILTRINLIGIIVYLVYLLYSNSYKLDNIAIGWTLCNIIMWIMLLVNIYTNYKIVFRLWITDIIKHVQYLLVLMSVIYLLDNYYKLTNLNKLLFSILLCGLFIFYYFNKYFNKNFLNFLILSLKKHNKP